MSKALNKQKSVNEGLKEMYEMGMAAEKDRALR
jgi:hypothetical protein